MVLNKSLSIALAAAFTLTSCAALDAPKKNAPAIRTNEDPFPSTYVPYPSVPTAIRGATIFDGEGGQIANGTVILAGGVVQAVGGPDLAIPEGAQVIDGTGKFVTPGVIDVHSHLGDYPRRAWTRCPTGTRRRRRFVPRSGPSIASGRRTQGSAGRLSMAG